ASYMTGGSGEKEFQKTLDAMKQVHSFRSAFSATQETRHSEGLWEVDCGTGNFHHQMHLVDTGGTQPYQLSDEEINVGGQAFNRQPNGTWKTFSSRTGTGAAYVPCRHLVDGTDGNVFPPIATMIKRGIIQKGDKKTVNGVRCREWLVTIRGGAS